MLTKDSVVVVNSSVHEYCLNSDRLPPPREKKKINPLAVLLTFAPLHTGHKNRRRIDVLEELQHCVVLLVLVFVC